jgi:hypothetical protein
VTAPCCSSSWLAVDRTARTLDTLVSQTFGARHAIAKERDPDPLDDDGYQTLGRELYRHLLEAVDDIEARVVAQVARDLRAAASLTPDARADLLTRALRTVERLAATIAPRVAAVLEAFGNRLLTRTKVATKGRYDLPASSALTQVDRAVLSHVVAVQGHFLRRHYEKRARTLRELARRLLASPAGRDLAVALREANAARAENHYRTVAAVFLGRVRSFGMLSALAASGVVKAVYQARNTPDTCDYCRLLDGRVFSVPVAFQQFLDVATSDDPDAVKYMQPFVSKGKDARGEYLYVKDRKGERVTLARVLESAVGRAGGKGYYQEPDRLPGVGVHTPPIHPQCLCRLVPVIPDEWREEPVVAPARGVPFETIGTPRAPVVETVRPVPQKPAAQRLTEGPPVPVPPKTTVELVPIGGDGRATG